MPLQVFSHALELPDPVVRISEPGWLFAETVNWGGVTGMLVQRSPIVRDTDPMYEPVTELLARYTPELIYQGACDEPGMMFGRSEVLIYLLHDGEPSEPTDPRTRIIVDMIRNWGDPVPSDQVADEINRRLELEIPCRMEMEHG